MDSQATTSASTSSLGEELKRRREQRGISLRSISDETRINMRFLQAIESDNYRVLPGAVFNRRFVAAVAKQVGMDEEEAVRRYVEQEQAHSDDDSSDAYQLPPVTEMTIGQEPQRRSRIWIIPVVLLALGGIGFGAWKTSPGFRSQVSGLFAKDGGESKPEQQNAPAPKPAPQTPAQPQTAAPQATNSVNAAALKIDIKVIQNQCWIQTRLDGGPAKPVTLSMGEERSFEPKEKMELWIGETKNIEMKINGNPTHFDASVVKRAVITAPGNITFPPPEKPKKPKVVPLPTEKPKVVPSPTGQPIQHPPSG